MQVWGLPGMKTGRGHQQRDVELQAALVEKGVWLRPFGTLIYCMPPYVISEGELRP